MCNGKCSKRFGLLQFINWGEPSAKAVKEGFKVRGKGRHCSQDGEIHSRNRGGKKRRVGFQVSLTASG